jgi:hypothetical protein
MQNKQCIELFALPFPKRHDFLGIDLVGYFVAEVIDADDVTGLEQTACVR